MIKLLTFTFLERSEGNFYRLLMIYSSEGPFLSSRQEGNKKGSEASQSSLPFEISPPTSEECRNHWLRVLLG